MKFSVSSFFLLLILFVFHACEEDTGQHKNPTQLTLTKTTLGGCNTENELKSYSEESDTLAFTLINDTLDAFVGLNYICCAPFNSETNISNDSIFIVLNDVCGQTDQACYCHCMCYYTWDFLFTELEEKAYYFKVILNDPRQSEPIIFKEVTIEITHTN